LSRDSDSQKKIDHLSWICTDSFEVVRIHKLKMIPKIDVAAIAKKTTLGTAVGSAAGVASADPK